MVQQRSLPGIESPSLEDTASYTDVTSGTFLDNNKLPIHRWFRYSAGYSGAWAKDLIQREANDQSITVFDPFVGCGTTLIAAEHCGVDSWGIDSHPFVARIAQAKLAYRSSPMDFERRTVEVLKDASRRTPNISLYPHVIRRCFTDDYLRALDCLRQAVEDMPQGRPSSRLTWLTLVAILRSVSHVGTASWQYLLPKRRKKIVTEPFAAYHEKAHIIHQDMMSADISGPASVFALDDARSCKSVPSNIIDLVVTSPPYPNNYDYADATRLEQSFLQEIYTWGDLQKHTRKYLLRSCSQHVPEKSIDLEAVIDHKELTPIRDEINHVCNELGRIRLSRGGKKTYHNMVACYFLDLAKVWESLRRVCKSPSKVCFVIGDSAPYGVYVPVYEWLGKLALNAGFSSFSFEKIRDRNVKWKNRKHRVPLSEGRLWVSG
ncbi:MAG: DNA modification methylase [Chloroflexi bacterium]|nr:DNA modification methylase [Chloroflexota bacterium]